MKKEIILLYITVMMICSSVDAQFIYTNEDCSGALSIPVGTTGKLSDSVYQRNNYAASVQSTIPLCGGGTNVYNDLWYQFTASDTTIAVWPEYYSGFYQLFSGGCANLTSITCNPAVTAFTPLTGLTVGQHYYLRTFSSGALSNNSLTVGSNYKLTLLTRPSNDECNNAALLPVHHTYNLGGESRFTNDLATASNNSCVNSTGWTNYKDVWYKFVATNTTHTVYGRCLSACSFACYSGTSGNMTLIDGFSTSVSSFSNTMEMNNLIVGQTYYIRAGHTSTVKFDLAITTGTPSNDECTGADTLLMSSSFNCEHSYEFSRMGSTASTTPCTQILHDTWFVFQSTSTDVIIRTTGDGGSNLRLGLYNGGCGSLSCIIYATDGLLTYSGLTIGNYYYINVGAQSDEELVSSICITPGITNDDCSGASTIIMQPYKILNTQIGYNENATTSLPACSGGGQPNDVWYKFTATDTACIVAVFTEGTNPCYEVFSGNCGALNSIYCSQTNTMNRISSLSVGAVYYIRFYTEYNVDGLLSVNVFSLVPNDHCNGAKVLTPQSSLDYELAENGIKDATESLAPCNASVFPTNDIWYKFTATENISRNNQ